MRVLALLLGVLLAAASLEVVFQILPSRIVGYDVDHEEEKFIRVVEFAPDGSVNREFFHDVDHALGPVDATRVILLGDSYVEAKQVRLSQTVGQQLENALVSRSGHPFEVISIGRANWGQATQHMALKNAGRLYQPDIVVTLFLGLNDVSDDSPEILRRLQQNDAKMFRRRPGWIDPSFEDAPHLYSPRSALNRFASHRSAILQSQDA